MFATETGGDGAFFEGVVYCVSGSPGRSAGANSIRNASQEAFLGQRGNLRRAEVLLEHDVHASQEFGHEEVVSGFVEGGFFAFVPALCAREAEA